jgi:hypothetical protein
MLDSDTLEGKHKLSLILHAGANEGHIFGKSQ